MGFKWSRYFILSFFDTLHVILNVASFWFLHTYIINTTIADMDEDDFYDLEGLLFLFYVTGFVFSCHT